MGKRCGIHVALFIFSSTAFFQKCVSLKDEKGLLLEIWNFLLIFENHSLLCLAGCVHGYSPNIEKKLKLLGSFRLEPFVKLGEALISQRGHCWMSPHRESTGKVKTHTTLIDFT